MKRLSFLMVVAMLVVSGLTNVDARSKQNSDMEKCCKQVKKEVRKALEGPSFEYLLPDAHERITLKCIVNEQNQLIFHKIAGEDERLIEYVKETLKNTVITVDKRFAKKMLRFDLVFFHEKIS